MKNLGLDKIELYNTITKTEIDKIACNPQIKSIQTSQAIEEQVYLLLNNILFSIRPDIQLRLYAFYHQTCDLAFMSKMTNVKHFAADCIMDATNYDRIAEIPNLKSLSIGIYNLSSFDFLKRATWDIESLSIHATKSTKNNLEFIKHFNNLKSLYLENQDNGIEIISQLHNLEKLTFRSISVDNLSHIINLKKTMVVSY